MVEQIVCQNRERGHILEYSSKQKSMAVKLQCCIMNCGGQEDRLPESWKKQHLVEEQGSTS